MEDASGFQRPDSRTIKVRGTIKKGTPYAVDDLRRLLPMLQPLNPDVHQSGIGHLATCPRYALFSDVYGLRIRGGLSAADQGTLFHKLCEYRLAGMDDLSMQKAYIDLVNQEEQRILQWGLDTGNITPSQDKLEKLKLYAVKAEAMLPVYFQKCSIPKHLKIVASELVLRVEVVELKCIVQCTIDVVLADERKKSYVIWDHKTCNGSGDPVQSFVEMAGFDPQSRINRLALTCAINNGTLDLPKWPVKEFWWGVIQPPTIKWKAESRGQSRDDYIAECHDWYKGTGDWAAKRAVLVRNKPPIVRVCATFKEPLLTNELATFVTQTAKAYRMNPKLSNFPRWGAASRICARMYGKRCPYLPLCGNEQGITDTINMYEVNPHGAEHDEGDDE